MSTTPKDVKQPTDRQSKAEEPAPEAPRVVTVRGTGYDVDPEAFDDFELMDDLERLGQPDGITRLPSILRRLLGDKQMRAVMDLLRDPETKRVTFGAGDEFVSELLEALNPN